MNFLFYFKVFLAFVLVFDTAKSFTINCNYEIRQLSIIAEVYACVTANIPYLSGDKVTAVSGSHLSNKTNNDVDYIWFHGNSTLSFFPRGINKIFPHIKAISIYYSTFDTLYGDELNEFPELEWFNIYQSKLTRISSRLFEKTPKMVSISFGETLVERVGHDLFTPLTKLVNLLFYKSSCIDRVADNQTAIIDLIDEIKMSCPFYDEEYLSCSGREIEVLVCDLKDEINEVQNVLFVENDKIDEIETELRKELQLKDEKMDQMRSEFEIIIDELQSRVLYLENVICIGTKIKMSGITFILMIFVYFLKYFILKL